MANSNMETAVINETTLEEITTAANTEVSTEVGFDFRISGENLMTSLPIMGKGMLGIFVVTAVIIVCVSLLNHFTSPDRKKKKDNAQN